MTYTTHRANLAIELEPGDPNMSEALRLVPHNREELYARIVELYKARSHVKGISVDEVHAVIAIDLDRAAHAFNHPDMRIPIKRTEIVRAQGVVNRINRNVSQSLEPTRADSDEIFDLVDVNG